MTQSLTPAPRLEGISPKAYEHPADRAATAALQSIPGMDRVVRALIEYGYERSFRQSFLAGSVKLGQDQLPQVWTSYVQALEVLDMPSRYDVYLTQMPVSNAMAIGSGRPMILVSSGALGLLDEAELRTVLAHEIGHVLSDHVLYRTALEILLRIGTSARLPFLAGLPLMAIRSALLEWFRASELSCDRAATLVVRDPLIVCRTLMVIAGGRASKDLNLEAFLRQAAEYDEGDGFDRVTRLFRDLNLTHTRPVRRAVEVMEWVRSGDYDRILGGDYPRRGDPVDARKEAGDAVDHYADRFRDIFREAGEGVASAGHQLSDWLKKRGGDDGPDDEERGP